MTGASTAAFLSIKTKQPASCVENFTVKEESCLLNRQVCHVQQRRAVFRLSVDMLLVLHSTSLRSPASGLTIAFKFLILVISPIGVFKIFFILS